MMYYYWLDNNSPDHCLDKKRLQHIFHNYCLNVTRSDKGTVRIVKNEDCLIQEKLQNNFCTNLMAFCFAYWLSQLRAWLYSLGCKFQYYGVKLMKNYLITISCCCQTLCGVLSDLIRLMTVRLSGAPYLSMETGWSLTTAFVFEGELGCLQA